ncbi:response regulator [Sphingobium yanoikuyae]|nr:response regulator [Sphingobium yanoikuyae]
MSLSLRIAVIDDDEEMRFALEDLLSSYSHVVQCYDSGSSFLDGHKGFRPDMIVTDYHMPGLTGIETVKRLRATGASTPAVLISAFANDTLREAALEAGSLALLKKPFDPDELIRLIDEAAGN